MLLPSSNKKLLIARTLFVLFCLIIFLFNLLPSLVIKRHYFNYVPVAEEEGEGDVEMSFQPWRSHNDPECSSFVVQFILNASQPLMALATYPGSGNTWIRGLIERLTGYFTGSPYADKRLFQQGLYGEMMRPDCGCTLIQKTHGFNDNVVAASNGSRIVVIRNPYESFKSYRNLNGCEGDHVGHAPADHFRGSEILLWKEKMFNWIPGIRRGGILHYENVVNDQTTQLRQLVEYFNLQVDERRLQCTVKHNFKTFHRNKSTEHEINPYSEDQMALIDAAIIDVNNLLLQHNYQPMPFGHYKYFNSNRVNTI